MSRYTFLQLEITKLGISQDVGGSLVLAKQALDKLSNGGAQI